MADSHAHVPAASAGHAHPQGHVPNAEDAHHVADHLRLYRNVGILLFVFTAITVGLSYVNFGSHAANIGVGMLVATFKASLVAAIFMHLKGEKATIWRFLIFTFIFFIGMFALTLLHEMDPIPGTEVIRH